MFWVILFSVWGGFLLGVIFMAILSMARDERQTKQAGRPCPESIVPAKAVLPPRESKIKAMHG